MIIDKRIIKDVLHPETYGEGVDLYPRTSIDQVVGVNEEDKPLVDTLEEIINTQETHSGEIKSAQKHLIEHGIQIRDIQNILIQHGQKIESVQLQVDGHETTINEIITEIGNMDDRITSMGNTVNELSDVVSGHSAAIYNINVDLGIAKNDIESLKTNKMDSMVIITSNSQVSVDGVQVPEITPSQMTSIHNAFIENKIVKVVSTTLHTEFIVIEEHDFDGDMLTCRIILNDNYIITYQLSVVGSYEAVIVTKNALGVGGGFLDAHPVDSYYECDYNPAEIHGGIWEQLRGRCLVSADDIDFYVGEYGGAKNVTLLVSHMPSHEGHLYPDPRDKGSLNGKYLSTSALATYGNYSHGWDEPSGQEAYPAQHFIGGGLPHENMPPYWVTKIWKRIA